MTLTPTTHFDGTYSSPGASVVPWSTAVETLNKAEVFWVTTIRPNGRPHVVPVLALWLDDALYFTTGEIERKAKNIAANPYVTVSTGVNIMGETLDVIIEGDAVRQIDKSKLQRIADAYVTKYGEGWTYDVVEGGLKHAAIADRAEHQVIAYVFEVKPISAFGFGRGAEFSQTTWKF